MRYPTHQDGLAVCVYELGYSRPPEALLSVKGLFNVHHLYWPHSKLNNDPVMRIFKDAFANTRLMHAREHNTGKDTLHTEYDPPRIPKLGTMIDFLDEQIGTFGVIDCVKQNKTNEHVFVTACEWERAKNGIQNVHATGNSLSRI